jgi:hypothetical protein
MEANTTARTDPEANDADRAENQVDPHPAPWHRRLRFPWNMLVYRAPRPFWFMGIMAFHQVVSWHAVHCLHIYRRLAPHIDPAAHGALSMDTVIPIAVNIGVLTATFPNLGALSFVAYWCMRRGWRLLLAASE